MRVSELDGLRVGLWGAGREAAAAHAALRRLAPAASEVVVTDAPVEPAEHERFAGARFASGEAALDALAACDVVIRSPGISRYRPEAQALARAGVTITTGTNLWFAERTAAETVIAVTGTKGKSTTASLIAHLLAAGGTRAELAGNIGRPLLDALSLEPAPEIWVLELSSYQVADLERGPRIGVVLNLFREHLDWHGTEEVYFADKLRLVGDPRTVAVLNARDARLRALDLTGRDVRWFGAAGGYDVCDGAIVRDGAELVPRGALPLVGEHNALNACAALAALEAAGREVAEPAAALAGFRPLRHRLEPVHRDGNVEFVDDSISTTPESTLAALAALDDRPVALLAGGHDRRQDYGALAEELAGASHVRAVLALPANGSRLLEAIRAAGPRSGLVLREAEDLDAAVALARSALPEGGVVLLSPAAPSYGAFRNFEERGDRFAAAARALSSLV